MTPIVQMYLGGAYINAARPAEARVLLNEAVEQAGKRRPERIVFAQSLERNASEEPLAVGIGDQMDGGLHLLERSTTSQRTNSTGQQTTEQRVEQPNPGDPGSALKVITLTTDTVRPSVSGAQATRTIQARDASGSLRVVSVDTTKSDNIHAIQVQIAPSESPK